MTENKYVESFKFLSALILFGLFNISPLVAAFIVYYAIVPYAGFLPALAGAGIAAIVVLGLLIPYLPGEQ